MKHNDELYELDAKGLSTERKVEGKMAEETTTESKSCVSRCSTEFMLWILSVMVVLVYYVFLVYHVAFIIRNVIIDWNEYDSHCLLYVKLWGLASIIGAILLAWYTALSMSSHGDGLMKLTVVSVVFLGLGWATYSVTTCGLNTLLYTEFLFATAFLTALAVISFFWTYFRRAFIMCTGKN